MMISEADFQELFPEIFPGKPVQHAGPGINPGADQPADRSASSPGQAHAAAMSAAPRKGAQPELLAA